MIYVCLFKIPHHLNNRSADLSPEYSRELTATIAGHMFNKEAELISLTPVDRNSKEYIPTQNDNPATFIKVQVQLDEFLTEDIAKNKQRILERIEVILRAGNLILTELKYDGDVGYLEFAKQVLADL